MTKCRETEFKVVTGRRAGQVFCSEQLGLGNKFHLQMGRLMTRGCDGDR